MFIRGLSNHLCLVATIIIGQYFTTTLFLRVRAATDSHDFTNSRQFKRNLGVSKYRNNTHWLPNYTWREREKFHGPRKKPAWELKETIETEADKEKRREYEKWDRMMREVTRREREKWKNYESDDTATSTDDDSRYSTEIKSAERSLDDRSKNRSWESSVDLDDDSSRRSAKTRKKKLKDNRERIDPDEDTSITTEATIPTTFPTNRWGMSVMKAPKKFLRAISGGSSSRGRKDSSQRFKDEIRTSRGASKEDSTSSRSSSHWRTRDEPEVSGVTFPPGRWGISVKKPPKDFLEEIARGSTSYGISNEVSRSTDRKFDDGELAGGKKRKNGEEAPTKVWMGLPTGGWTTGETSQLLKFLREISSPGQPGIVGFYKPVFSHQLAPDTIPINDPRSSELTSHERLRISNLLFLQPSPRILQIPVFPGYLMNSGFFKIPSKTNVPVMPCMICHN